MVVKTIRQISKDACSAACLTMVSDSIRARPVSQKRLSLQIGAVSPLRVSTEVGIALAALKNGFYVEAYRSGGAVTMKECIAWVVFCEKKGDFGRLLGDSERKAIARKFKSKYISTERKIWDVINANSNAITVDSISRLARHGITPVVLVDDFFIDYMPPHDLHWVVVSGFSRGVFTINDPGFITGKGVLRMKKDQFAKAISTERHGIQRRMVLVKGINHNHKFSCVKESNRRFMMK